MAVKVRHVTSERAVAQLTLNLTAKAKGCAKRPGELVCTASVSLLPGRYIVQIATFDRYNGLGNVLSKGQTVPVSVAPSRNTLVRLTLDGVPYSLAVTGINPAVHGSQNGPFEIYGTAAQPMRVMAFDADGNAIVGAGAPSYQIKLLNGTGWSVQATPPSATPNTFTISPPGAQGSTAMLSVTAAGPADCKEPKAQCTIGFSVANHLQTLFAGGTCRSGCTGEVLAYAPPYTGAPVTVDNSLGSITAMTTDSSGNLFVASCNVSCGDGTAADSVTEYAPPYTGGASATITNGITHPLFIAVAADGKLFVIDETSSGPGSSNTLTAYTPPYTSAPAINVSVAGAGTEGMAVDASGDVATTNCSLGAPPRCETSGVSVYLPPAYTTSTFVRPNDLEAAYRTVQFDLAGDLFVSEFHDSSSGEITEYRPPFALNQAAAVTITAGLSGPLSFALDPPGNIFAGNSVGAPNDVVRYTPPYTGYPTPSRTQIAAAPRSASAGPVAVAIDGADDVFAINGDGSATVNAPPYAKANAVATQLATASALAVSP